MSSNKTASGTTGTRSSKSPATVKRSRTAESGATSANKSGGSYANLAKTGDETSAATAAAASGVGEEHQRRDSTPIKYCPRPSRGFSAMTDDRGTAAVDAAKCGPPCCVPNGCTKQEGHYACDRQAAKVLAQYVTPDERDKVLRWLDVLQTHGACARTAGDDADEDEQSERSMYLTCLLMLLRSGRLVAPFTRHPPVPPRPLKPLRDAVDRRLYKRVQIECRRRRLHEPARYERPDDEANSPSGFFDRMPEPCDGVLCYGAVFSDIS